MITLTHVNYQYPGPRGEWVLKGIDLTLREGEYVLVCGASGSGKSTLAYVFNGLIPHFFRGVLNGAVLVNGMDTREAQVSDLFPSIGLVLQNADAQLFCSTVEHELAFGLESLGTPWAEIEGRIHETAHSLNIGHLLDRSPAELSGGEKRLVAIASVLCLDPPILLLDEPLAHLDWEGAMRVREALIRIHKTDKTIIVIEQRIGSILQDVGRCVVMSQGQIHFDGPPKEAYPLFVQEHLVPSYTRVEQRGSMEKPLLVAQDIRQTLSRRQVLKGVSLEVRQGEIVSLVGRNGSGKTTLIKHLNGLLKRKKGQVTVHGEDMGGKGPSEAAALVGLAFQNPNDQFFKNTVKDELLVGLRPGGSILDPWVHEVCNLFDLHGLLDQPPYQLSEGQKKRVALASILVMRPKVLVLDEPTLGQDGRFLETLAQVLLSLKRHGLGVLIATHDLEFAMTVADRWLLLEDGRIVGQGVPDDMVKGDDPLGLGTRGHFDHGPSINLLGEA